jgi:hypothetical protein
LRYRATRLTDDLIAVGIDRYPAADAGDLLLIELQLFSVFGA